MYYLLQKRHFFRVKNVESGHFLSLQDGANEMKSGRVVAAPEAEPQSDIWFYQDGLIKNKVRTPEATEKHSQSVKFNQESHKTPNGSTCVLQLAPAMSLQVMGNVEPAAKVVLWSETRQPIQTWAAKMKGLISSLTFPGMVLDVKGTASESRIIRHRTAKCFIFVL